MLGQEGFLVIIVALAGLVAYTIASSLRSSGR
jgi:hypothetical protein